MVFRESSFIYFINLFYIRQCSLCHGSLKANKIGGDFYDCSLCRGILRDDRFYVSLEDEKKRYEEHNNNVDDPRYQKFVSPITDAVLRDFNKNATGLDFGAGTGPVISKVLRDHNYSIVTYDPFFCNKPEVLKEQYDYIVCCEVVEHFYRPDKEFELLKNLLKPGGKLYCMTHLYSDKVDFEKWYYKNDSTHVFFYRAETFKWIKEHFRFNNVFIDGRLIELSA